MHISETETPLHRMETIYRRALENLRTREVLEARYIAATVMDVSEAQQGAA